VGGRRRRSCAGVTFGPKYGDEAPNDKKHGAENGK
jgi:hypothetical protein